MVRQVATLQQNAEWRGKEPEGRVKSQHLFAIRAEAVGAKEKETKDKRSKGWFAERWGRETVL